MIDLITGHQGVSHISADQIATINNAMMDNFGANKVMRLVGGELTANGLTIEVGTGYWRANGFDMEVQEAETIYIDPTAAGLSRIDNIYVEILQDIPTGAQRSEIVTVNGEPSATPTAPEAPTAPELNTDILLQVVPLASVTVTEGAMVMEDYSVAYNIVIPEDLAEVQTEVDTIVNVYGAKNFISIDIEKTRASNTTGAWSGNSYVIRGITFIINADGTVTADGTASANVGLYLIPRGRKALTLPVGDYRITSTPSGGSNAKYFTELTYTDSNNAGQSIGYEYGSGYNFSITSNMISNYFDIGINLYVMNGQTVSNMLFKPMICCASIQDDTYVPYAKTNKELTDAFTNQVADSDDTYSPSKAYKVGEHCIYNNVIYKCITACSAGSWTTNRSCFSQTTLTSAVTDLNSALSDVGTITIIATTSSTTWQNITVDLSDYKFIEVHLTNASGRTYLASIMSKEFFVSRDTIDKCIALEVYTSTRNYGECYYSGGKLYYRIGSGSSMIFTVSGVK